MNARNQHGFNILELMVGITVLGVLLGIGVPSFTEMIRTNRAVSQTNDLIGALNYARSEALKRGTLVSVCPAAGTVCSGGTDWSTGVLVFEDDSGTAGTLDGTDKPLQSWRAYQNALTASGPAAVIFTPTGAQTVATVDIFKSGCTGDQMRRVRVEITGRIRLTKETCS